MRLYWGVALAAVVAGIAILASMAGSGDAAFPGENGQMVFAHMGTTTRAQLYTRQANGGFLQQLTNPPVDQDDFNPSWSPGGARVAFERLNAGEFEIRVVNADGSGDVAVPGGEGGRRPSWAPDGNRIVFEREGELFAISADGSGLTHLTAGFDTPAYEADWSPDGTRIAFKTDLGGREPVFIMNADGTNPVQLESLTGPLADGYPDWSPDGTKIAYDQFNEDTEDFDVFVVNIDGTGRENLTDDIDTDAKHPAWSPDGTKLLFENDSIVMRSGVDGAGFVPIQLFEMAADGSNKRNLTADVLLADVDPDWGSAPAPPTATPAPGQGVIWGDNRCDGTLEATDSLAALRHIAALSELSQTEPCPSVEQMIVASATSKWADVDCDLDVDAVDALRVLRTIAGFVVEPPPNCNTIGEETVIFYEP